MTSWYQRRWKLLWHLFLFCPFFWSLVTSQFCDFSEGKSQYCQTTVYNADLTSFVGGFEKFQDTAIQVTHEPLWTHQRWWKKKNSRTEESVHFSFFISFPFSVIFFCFKFSIVFQARLDLHILLFLSLSAEIINIHYCAQLSCHISSGSIFFYALLVYKITQQTYKIPYPILKHLLWLSSCNLFILSKILKTDSLPFIL